MSDFKKINERTFDFALLTIETCKFLAKKKEFNKPIKMKGGDGHLMTMLIASPFSAS